MSNLARRLHESLFQWKIQSPARLYAWLLAPSSLFAMLAIGLGASRKVDFLVLATELTLLLFDPVAARIRARVTPIGSAAVPLPRGSYRTSARAHDEAEEIIGFVKTSYSGEDVSRSQSIRRIAAASALLAVGLPARAYTLDLFCIAIIFSSIPAVQRWLTRRRLRAAGLHAELSEYEASLETR